MFDILFGWRKASKCKKLVRGVQCRLKLLKNKRCSIVRQLRDDVAQLLKYGHDQSAFDRVEQLFKDESIVAVYDLLDHFCEFILIHLSYIRKHKDCPNDINEAASTLIFASARCGDLPELRVIRKLFGERYGQRFAMVALELLPGNLVNRQIKENLSIQSVPNDVKYRLLDEIARSCLQPGPLALEYYSELQQEQVNKNKGDQDPRSDVQTNCNGDEGSQVQALSIVEAERKIVLVDLIEPYELHRGTGCTGAVGTHTVPLDHKEVDMALEFSSESSSQLPTEMIYLDDIEEFKSPRNKDENSQDQRLFLFKSSVILTTDKLEEDGFSESFKKKNESWNEKTGSRKSRNESGKRHRRKSISQESFTVKDVESTIYYGDLCAISPNDNHKSHHRRKYQKKIPLDEKQKSCCTQARLCSLEKPCYICISDDKDDWENQKCKITTFQGLPAHNLKEAKIEHCVCNCQFFCIGDTKMEWEVLHQKPRRNYQIAADSQYSCSRVSSPRTIKNTHPPYLRAVTMPLERPSDCHTENILRSNSFPFQQPSHSSNGSPTCRHVHPKLPDYDQLSATFMALKKANQQHKTNQLV
ncbi:unnamed protein product [Camellia sinensis]